MLPEDMLKHLHDEGVSARADFNDNEEILGWFGWEIEGDVLTVKFDNDNEDVYASWRLTLLGEDRT